MVNPKSKPEPFFLLEFADPRGRDCAYYDLQNGYCIPLAMGCGGCLVYPVRKSNQFPPFDGGLSMRQELMAYESMKLRGALEESPVFLQRWYVDHASEMPLHAMIELLAFNDQKTYQAMILCVERKYLSLADLQSIAGYLRQLKYGREWEIDHVLRYCQLTGHIADVRLEL